MIDYTLILSKNYAGKKWILNGDSYDGLNWLDELPKPTKEELDSQWIAIQAYIDANAYIAKRQAEYPPITDYLDGVVKGDQTQIDKYIADCLSVKAKYPKVTT
jgi:hypothetical protein